MGTDHSPTDSLQVGKPFRRPVGFTKSVSGARPHPNPVARTPSASKSPHPDRSDPDRAEPGHCRMPRAHRVKRPAFTAWLLLAVLVEDRSDLVDHLVWERRQFVNLRI